MDTQKGSNLLYLPLDKLVGKGNEAAKTAATTSQTAQPSAETQSTAAVQGNDATGDIDARTMMRLRGR